MQRLLLGVPLNIIAVVALVAMVVALGVLFVGGIPGAGQHAYGAVFLPVAVLAVSAAVPVFFFLFKHVLAVQSLRHKGAGLLFTAVILGFNITLVMLSLNYGRGITAFVGMATLLPFQFILSWKIHRSITSNFQRNNTLGVFSKESISIISLGTVFIGAVGLLHGVISSVELTMLSSMILILGIFGWYMSKNLD
jgi:hypothetical protein